MVVSGGIVLVGAFYWSDPSVLSCWAGGWLFTLGSILFSRSDSDPQRDRLYWTMVTALGVVPFLVGGWSALVFGFVFSLFCDKTVRPKLFLHGDFIGAVYLFVFCWLPIALLLFLALGGGPWFFQETPENFSSDESAFSSEIDQHSCLKKFASFFVLLSMVVGLFCCGQESSVLSQWKVFSLGCFQVQGDFFNHLFEKGGTFCFTLLVLGSVGVFVQICRMMLPPAPPGPGPGGAGGPPAGGSGDDFFRRLVRGLFQGLELAGQVGWAVAGIGAGGLGLFVLVRLFQGQVQEVFDQARLVAAASAGAVVGATQMIELTQIVVVVLRDGVIAFGQRFIQEFDLFNGGSSSVLPVAMFSSLRLFGRFARVVTGISTVIVVFLVFDHLLFVSPVSLPFEALHEAAHRQVEVAAEILRLAELERANFQLYIGQTGWDAETVSRWCFVLDKAVELARNDLLTARAIEKEFLEAYLQWKQIPALSNVGVGAPSPGVRTQSYLDLLAKFIRLIC